MNAASKIRSLREEARKQDLIVLVWGPGDPGASAPAESRKFWVKRGQIRDAVQKNFPAAEVVFSESDSLRDHTRDLEDLLTEELLHAAIADCILVLDVSRGAHVEVDRFTTKPTLAAKIRVLIPDKWVGSKGLIGSVHQDTRVRGFSEDEFELCSLATEKCVTIVLSFAIRKMMNKM